MYNCTPELSSSTGIQSSSNFYRPYKSSPYSCISPRKVLSPYSCDQSIDFLLSPQHCTASPETLISKDLKVIPVCCSYNPKKQRLNDYIKDIAKPKPDSTTHLSCHLASSCTNCQTSSRDFHSMSASALYCPEVQTPNHMTPAGRLNSHYAGRFESNASATQLDANSYAAMMGAAAANFAGIDQSHPSSAHSLQHSLEAHQSLLKEPSLGAEYNGYPVGPPSGDYTGSWYSNLYPFTSARPIGYPTGSNHHADMGFYQLKEEPTAGGGGLPLFSNLASNYQGDESQQALIAAARYTSFLSGHGGHMSSSGQGLKLPSTASSTGMNNHEVTVYKEPKEKRPCDVCGDVSAGFHCNAFVCEACKKFFIRSSKNDNYSKYSCTKTNMCQITKDTRTHCQFCRYNKCLRLGMSLPGTTQTSGADISVIPCRVCGAHSSGFHFGAITCEGCKGFFRRTINERDNQKYTCSKGDNCVINLSTRNNCKSCRYEKCLSVGMSKDGSRIGRQPNAVKHMCAKEIEHIKATQISGPHSHHSLHHPLPAYHRNSSLNTMNPSSSSHQALPQLHHYQQTTHNTNSTNQHSHHHNHNSTNHHHHNASSSSRYPYILRQSTPTSSYPSQLSSNPSNHVTTTPMPTSAAHPSLHGAPYTLSPGTSSPRYLPNCPTANHSTTFNQLYPAHVYETPNFCNTPVDKHSDNRSSSTPFNFSNSTLPTDFNASSHFKDDLPERANPYSLSPYEMYHQFPNQSSSSDAQDMRQSPTLLDLDPPASQRHHSVSSSDSSTSGRLYPTSVLAPPVLTPPSASLYIATSPPALGSSPPRKRHRDLSTTSSENITYPTDDMGQQRQIPRLELPPSDGQMVYSEQYDCCANNNNSSYESGIDWHRRDTEETEDFQNAGLLQNSPACLRPESSIPSTPLVEHSVRFSNDMQMTTFLKAISEAAKSLCQCRRRKTTPLPIKQSSIDETVLWQHMMFHFEAHAYQVIAFARMVPGFMDLSKSDKMILMQEAMYPIIIFQLARDFNPITNEFNYFNFSGDERNLILSKFHNFKAIANHLLKSGKLIKPYNLDDTETALICTIELLKGAVRGGSLESSSIENPKMIEQIYAFAVNTFMEYTKRNLVQNRGIEILNILPLISKMNREHKDIITMLKGERPHLIFPNLYKQMFQIV